MSQQLKRQRDDDPEDKKVSKRNRGTDEDLEVFRRKKLIPHKILLRQIYNNNANEVSELLGSVKNPEIDVLFEILHLSMLSSPFMPLITNSFFSRRWGNSTEKGRIQIDKRRRKR